MFRVKRLLKSFRYAIRGIIKVFREEQNFRIQFFMAFLALFLGFYFRVDRIEWIFLILVIILVFLMEILNSAIERISDVIKPRISNYVKEIKDIMASAVFLASCLSLIVGFLIFFPYFSNLNK